MSRISTVLSVAVAALVGRESQAEAVWVYQGTAQGGSDLSRYEHGAGSSILTNALGTPPIRDVHLRLARCGHGMCGVAMLQRTADENLWGHRSGAADAWRNVDLGLGYGMKRLSNAIGLSNSSVPPLFSIRYSRSSSSSAGSPCVS